MEQLTLEKMIDLIYNFLEGNPGMFTEKRVMLISICEQFFIKGSISEKQEAIIKFNYPKIYSSISHENRFKSDNPNVREEYLKTKYSYLKFLCTENHPNPEIHKQVASGSIPACTLYDAWKQVVEKINNTELEDLNKDRVNLGLQPLVRMYFRPEVGWLISGTNEIYRRVELNSQFAINVEAIKFSQLDKAEINF